MHKSVLSVGRSRRLSVCWMVGLLLGILTAAVADSSVLPLMRLSVSTRVSIVSLFASAALPFLIAAYAVMIHNFRFLFALVFCRCFFFGFWLWLGVAAFGSAAWLVQPMLHFTDWLSLPALCLFCLRRCGGVGRWERDLTVCMIMTAVAAVVDFIAVSPYLAALFES